jgi:hypothetical protein
MTMPSIIPTQLDRSGGRPPHFGFAGAWTVCEPADTEARVRDLLTSGVGIVKTTWLVGVGVSAVQRIKGALEPTLRWRGMASPFTSGSRPGAPERRSTRNLPP